jgi:hypothetical protein
MIHMAVSALSWRREFSSGRARILDSMEFACEIFNWSEKQPMWRRDLMRRLAVAPTIDADAEQEILAAVIAEANGRPTTTELRSLALIDLPQAAGEPLTLTRLGDIVNVNGLAPEQEIAFGDGLNVLYGGTGAGKTGYTRVFKRTCRAVDDEQLLGDVYSGDTTPPSAMITITTATRVQELAIDLTQPGPPALAGIAVFDGRCADVYATRETVAFTPTPLRIFDRLASAQLRLREQVDARRDALERDRPSFSDIPLDTRARALVDALNAESDLAEIDRYATLSPSELERLAALDVELVQLEQSGPEALAAKATREAAALGGLSARIEELEGGLGVKAEGRLAQARAAVKATADAVELARPGAFSGEQVADTGSAGWRILWDAAREYAEHTCGSEFPPKQGDVCVLCQQPISAEAEARMAGFDAFVHGAIEREADKARVQLATALAEISGLKLAAVADLAGVGIVALDEPALHTKLEAFLAAVGPRAAALATGTEPPTLPKAPLEQLRALAAAREELAAQQLTLVDPAKKRALVDEARELRGRRFLGGRLDDIRVWHARLVEAALLARAHSGLDTTAITTKQHELTAHAVTDAMRQRMRAELDGLGFSDLAVELTCHGARGQTKVRAGITGVAVKPERVLSTGELRAVALALFLAEIASSSVDDPVVIDDPTLGFAPEHRRHFAKRLIEEAGKRQVVVLTHDLALVWELESRAKSAKVSCRCQSLRRVAGRPGIVRPDLPWVAAGVKQRRGDLNARIQTLDKLHRTGDDRYADETHLFVELLRETWERAFEERVLGGAVTRYEPAIHTQQLTKSAVDGEIVRRIEAGMSETSQWVHDQPRGGHGTVPPPDELRVALAQLDDFLAFLAKGAVTHIHAA